jgi:hypothetical protein
MRIKRAICYWLTLTLAAGMLSTLSGCGPVVIGSGKLVTEVMDYADFTKLSVGSAFQVEVTRADSYLVSVTVDDNLVEYLSIRKSGSTLYIGLKTLRGYLRATQRATITMPELRGLEISGASKGDVSGFHSSDSLDIEVSGASSLDIDDVAAGDTDFEVSGASKVTGSIEIDDGDFSVSGASSVSLDGSADDVRMVVSGASTMRLDDFEVSNADIELSGASKATVNVSGQMDVEVSGASNLYYLGSPTLGRLNVSGASNIRQR